ncbi:MAG: hypothetical protein DHS20C02_06710 [Micavibrio sp.]|nr:MAG: hypothetical protein DHS20C02_06710 [Micavibrio sp.]
MTKNKDITLILIPDQQEGSEFKRLRKAFKENSPRTVQGSLFDLKGIRISTAYPTPLEISNEYPDITVQVPNGDYLHAGEEHVVAHQRIDVGDGYRWSQGLVRKSLCKETRSGEYLAPSLNLSNP